MENKNFDDIIKSKLQELEQMPTDSDWDVFEELYDDQLAGSEAAFDRSIADKVENYNIAFNSNHWVLMKEKLEREEFIRTSIYFSKIAEAGIVFLLLFTFLHLFPGLQYEKSQKHFASSEFSDTNLNPQEIAVVEVESLNNGIVEHIQSDRFNKLLASISSETRSYINFESLDWPAENISLPVDHITPIENNTVSINSLTTPILAKEIASLENEKMEIYRALASPSNKSGIEGDSYLGFGFSPTVNIVNSPANYILKTNPYTVDALGFEAGIGYSIRKNKFEVGTGLTYAKKSYQPQLLSRHTGDFQVGYNETTLQNISFDMISVPFNLSYHILTGNNYSLYASAGSSFNIITNAGYRVNQNGQILESIDRIQESLRSSEREFTQGILQGGGIHDNLFISLDISIGLETKLTDGLNMFFAPTLRQHIGIAGIGPNGDKVHSLGLNIGIKKKL